MKGRRNSSKAIKEAKPNELEAARQAFRDKRVKVSVKFDLEKPREGSSDTIVKKGLDNMLKLVLDSLQTKADSQVKLDGLGLIQDDDCVYRLEANKRLVDRPEQAGVSISISQYWDCRQSSWTVDSGRSLAGGSLAFDVDGSNNNSRGSHSMSSLRAVRPCRNFCSHSESEPQLLDNSSCRLPGLTDFQGDAKLDFQAAYSRYRVSANGALVPA